MSSLVNVSINLDKITKSKIIKGEKGKYLNLTISVNDEVNSYGQNASIFESCEKGENKNYIGNGKVVWTDGKITKAGQPETPTASQMGDDSDDDLPF